MRPGGTGDPADDPSPPNAKALDRAIDLEAVHLGGDTMRMRAYGLLDPMTAMHRMMPKPGAAEIEMDEGHGHERH